MSFNQIKCPACNAWYTEYEWNKNTVEIEKEDEKND